MADKKKTLADMIRGSVGEASIAAMDAQAVPNPDTGRDRIEYLPLDKLQEDEKNFYSMNGIEASEENALKKRTIKAEFTLWTPSSRTHV